jgi:hypothetical protein
MTWSSTAPDGAQSVKANRTILGGNTTYIENTMGKTANDTTNSDSIRDHYWSVSASLDGRHRYINMPAYTIAGAITDPVIGASCNSVIYTKTKTPTESVFQQDVQPFFRNASGIMQILGIRACIVFDVTPAVPVLNPPTCTVQYSHNATLQAGALTYAGSRTFQINFTTALPSNNYLVYADSIPRASSAHQFPIVTNSNTLATVKATTFLNMTLDASSNSTILPLQIWVVCFGG